MSSMMFVNLPVTDLDRSVEFFTALGFSFNPDYTDENATCMLITDTSFVMLLVKPFFSTFTDKQIVDTATHTEVLIALNLDSREAVDEMVDRAIAAGGSGTKGVQDMGWMYGGRFEDPDGHHWEPSWMDPSKLPS